MVDQLAWSHSQKKCPLTLCILVFIFPNKQPSYFMLLKNVSFAYRFSVVARTHIPLDNLKGQLSYES